MSSRNRLPALAIAVVGAVVITCVSVASAAPARTTDEPFAEPSAEQVFDALERVAPTYPGGFAALTQLFTTGPCAGVRRRATASPECLGVVEEVMDVAASIGTRPIIDTMITVGTLPPPNIDPGPPPNTDPAPPPSTDPGRPPSTDPRPPPSTEPGVPTTTSPSASTTPPTPTPPTTTPPPTSPQPTTTPPTTSPSPTTTTTPTTSPSPTTTTTPAAQTPILVAVGDSVASGHEGGRRRPNAPLASDTVCDDPATSYANDLRVALGIPAANYFNHAHSGASTRDVLATFPYTNPCGVRSQPATTQITDAVADLRAHAGRGNWAVATAGVNNTNWVAVLTRILTGGVPAANIATPALCASFVHGGVGPNGQALPPAWNGIAQAATIVVDVADIVLQLHRADPAATVATPTTTTSAPATATCRPGAQRRSPMELTR